MTTTPNMNLVLPDVSATLGPAWATALNTLLALVDLHDHTTGNGVALTGLQRIGTISGYPYTVLSTDNMKVLPVSTAAARAITLPAATTAMSFTLKDATGNALTNNITVTAAGADTIDGAATFLIDANYQSATFISDGVSKWYVV